VRGETPFDDLSGAQVLALLRMLNVNDLSSEQILGLLGNPDAILEPLETLQADPQPGGARVLSRDQVVAALRALPDRNLSGEEVIVLLESPGAEHTTGRQAFEALVTILAYDARGEDVLQSVMTPPGAPTPDRLLNPGVYRRGALTLHALRLRVGDETFFRILRMYTGCYRHTNAGTEDFIAVAEEVSGEQLDEFFDGWLYADEVPDVPGLVSE